MPRKDMRMVQSRDTAIYTSNSRVQEDELTVYSFSGPVEAKVSGRWPPPKDVLITSWSITSATKGTEDLWIVLLIGDYEYVTEGEGRGVVILPADEMMVSGKVTFGNSVYNYPIATKNQWVAVQSSGATGHEDVVVQLYGKSM
jgi:hypothetical protein